MAEHTEPTLSPLINNLLHSDMGHEAVLAKRADFPGTAVLVEELVPFYQHALAGMKSDPGGAAKKFTPAPQADYSRLPAALAKEVREHLTALQTSAFGFEANGDTKRAKEIRDVATTVYSMLNTIQQISLHDPRDVAKPQPRTNGGAAKQ